MFYEFKHPIAADYFRVERGVDFDFPAHMHHCFEFLAVLDGEMHVEVDTAIYTPCAGEGLLFFPNQIHSMHTEKNSRHILCLFSPELVGAYAKKVSGKLPENNLFRPDETVIRYMDTLPEIPNRYLLKGMLYQLCGEFDQNAVYRNVPEATHVLLHDIFQFIEQNAHTDCSLEALSRHVGYDYAYLSRYFHRKTGMPYNRYLNRYRISRACYLLKNSTMTVLEISDECGFNSLRTMNRNFLAETGMPPAEYRRQHEGRVQENPMR